MNINKAHRALFPIEKGSTSQTGITLPPDIHDELLEATDELKIPRAKLIAVCIALNLEDAIRIIKNEHICMD